MDLSLLTVFLGCAALGGLILLVQTVMLLFGPDDGGDALGEGRQPKAQRVVDGVFQGWK